MSARPVVVIEDNTDDFAVLVRLYGHIDPTLELIRFQRGDDFLQALRAGEVTWPSYVLLDLNLPGPSGIDVLRELKGDAARGCLAVIMVSGSARPADVRDAYLAGANSYVVKPLDPHPYGEQLSALHRYWVGVVASPPGPPGSLGPPGPLGLLAPPDHG